MVNLGIYKKRSGVPVLSGKDIDVLGEKLVADFCPDALKEPQALDMDSFAQNYLGMIFFDKINDSRANPTPNLGKIESTNPCHWN